MAQMPHPQKISTRAVSLKPSLTLAIAAKAKELMREGKDICSLSEGEPDFDTPDFIVEAAIKALKDGETRYGPAAGDPELREAIALKLSKSNNIPTSSENILVTNGGKQAIYNLFQVILDQDSEVIIPSPYWLSYPQITKLAGGQPVIINSSPKEDFSINETTLEAAINDKTRLLILNSPGNPTGRVMKRKEMEIIAEILRKYPHVSVMSDEIYEYLLANGERHHSFANVAPDLANRIFTVNGFAKGWAMTGWRIGYLAGNKEVIKVATALQSQSTSNVCSFAQKGALAALIGPMECVQEMAKSYNFRRELLSNGIETIKGMKLVRPSGAFYAFPKLPPNSPNSVEFCKEALDQVGLALVPGIAFGDDRRVRISCATSNIIITDGINRLKEFALQF